MKKVLKYGWIPGLICVPGGVLQLYYYFSGSGSLSLGHLIIGLFTITAGVFNLTVYAVIKVLQ